MAIAAVRPIRFALAFGALLAAGQAGAADFTVTRTDDPLPDTCAPGDCSLREAVRAANAQPGHDRVLLSSSPVAFQLTLAGVAEDAAASGDLDVTGSLEIAGNSAATSVVIQFAADRVLHVQPGARLVLSRITVQGGDSVAQGAGVYVPSGTLQILDSVLQDNLASDRGGGVYLRPPASGGLALDVQRSRFVENAAALGGGVHVAGVVGTPAQVRFDFAEFLANDAVLLGGGLSLEGDLAAGSSVSVRRVTFVENIVTANAGAGGAIANGSSHSTIVDVSDSGFLGNRALGANGRGGALFEVQQVERSFFSQNTAAFGGASSGVALRLEDSELCDNAADHNGGAVVAVELQVLRSTFCRNQVSGGDVLDGGGAVYLEAPESSLVIERSTFDANVAALGGGVLQRDGGLFVSQSTLAEPVPATPGVQGSLLRYEGGAEDLVQLVGNILHGDCSLPQGAVVDRAEYNLIAPADTCGFFPQDEAHFGNLVAASTAEIPLQPLAENGGPTPTRVPGDSVVHPALNYLPPSACPQAIDQRGFVRFDSACDAGAVEAAAAPPVDNTLFADGFED